MRALQRLGCLPESSGGARTETLLQRFLSRAFQIAVAVAVVAIIWELAFIGSRGIGFVGIMEVLGAVGDLGSKSIFWTALIETVFLSVTGLALGLILALLIGIPLGSSRLMSVSTRGTINFARMVPPIALLPLLIVSFGNSAMMIFLLAAIVSSLKLVVFVVGGVRNTLPALRETARTFHFSRLRTAVLVLLPASAESVFMGLRLTVNRAYGVVVLGGLVTSGLGVGGQLAMARLSLDVSAVLAYALVAGVVGVLFFQAFSLLERKVIFWRSTR